MYAWSRYTPLRDVKVVILGQDPYHDDGERRWIRTNGAMSFFRPKLILRLRCLATQDKHTVRLLPRLLAVAFALRREADLSGPPYKTGLCFSVRPGVRIPPSLRNIYKEIKEEYPEFDVPKHGSVPRVPTLHAFRAWDPAVVESH